MSKTEKNVKAAHKPLRAELSQSVKVLHSLLSDLDKIEASLIESDKAIDAKSRYEEQLSKQERRIHDLQTSLEIVEEEREKEVTLFATANLKLNEDFHARLREQSVEYQSRLNESQRRLTNSEKKWKEALQSETVQIDHIKANEKATQRQHDTELKQVQQISQMKEDALQKKLQDTEQRLVELLERNRVLMEEVAQLNTIQRGRETETSILTKKLTNLEAFSPKSQQETSNLFASLKGKLQEFCSRCVDSAEILPTWNQFPEDFQQKGFPRFYSMDSTVGRNILCSAIQYSVCTAMVENIFTFLGLNPRRELDHISKALHQMNRSHEAIWRLSTSKAILGNQQILEGYQRKFRNVACDLLTYWKLFQSKDAQDNFLDMLSTILFDAFRTWWCLMKFRDRTYITIDGMSRHFEPDSGEKLVEMPGDFGVGDPMRSFCLFPALMEVASEDQSEQPHLLRKGTMLYSNSPSLLLALNEEQQLNSPRLSNKKVSKTVDSGSSRT